MKPSEEVEAALAPHVNTLLPRWLYGGKWIGREYVCSDVRGGSGSSMQVFEKNGSWCFHDKATGEGGGLIKLYAESEGIEWREALRILYREYVTGDRQQSYDQKKSARTAGNSVGALAIKAGETEISQYDTSVSAKKLVQDAHDPTIYKGKPVLAWNKKHDHDRVMVRPPHDETTHRALLREVWSRCAGWMEKKGVNPEPSLVFPYRDAIGRIMFYVTRHEPFTNEGGKEFRQWYFDKLDGCFKMGLPMKEKRPVYNLQQISAREPAPLVYVEGEKCADRISEVFSDGEMVPFTCCGGSKGVKQSDLSVLADRKIYICGDADEAGKLAAIDVAREALNRDAHVYAVSTKGQPRKSDVADFIDGKRAWPGHDQPVKKPARPGDDADDDEIAAYEAWRKKTGKILLQYIKERSQLVTAEKLDEFEKKLTQKPGEKSRESAQKKPEKKSGGEKRPIAWSEGWRADMKLTAAGTPKANLLNTCTAMRGLGLGDVLRLNQFSGFVEVTGENDFGLPVGQMTDDHIHTVMCILQENDIDVRKETVVQGIASIGCENPFHPLLDYFKNLPAWDGVLRLGSWLVDYCGVKANGNNAAYITAISRKWLIAAVRRGLGMSPDGVKMDTMLVLAGPQGVGKSTTFRVLGGEWFTDAQLDIRNKDAFISMAGKWIIEVPELSGMRSSEVEVVKRFVTAQNDRYRGLFQTCATDHPRRSVLCGTVNEHQFLNDTENRRFWPVTVGLCDTEGLARVRDQLWAEAYAAFMNGEKHWFDPVEDAEAIAQAVKEQADSRVGDPWEEALRDWLEAQDGRCLLLAELFNQLGIPVEKRTNSDNYRLGRVLKVLGWTNMTKHHPESGKTVSCYAKNGTQAYAKFRTANLAEEPDSLGKLTVKASEKPAGLLH